jgi:hypothetical protein
MLLTNAYRTGARTLAPRGDLGAIDLYLPGGVHLHTDTAKELRDVVVPVAAIAVGALAVSAVLDSVLSPKRTR